MSFNPEYTHDKDSSRYERWKRAVEIYDESKIKKKIHAFERKEVLAAVEVGQPTPSLLSRRARLKAGVLRGAKTWLRGDTLLATAAKS